MEVKCAIQFSGCLDAVMPEVDAFFTNRGWRNEGDVFTCALQAALGGVDAPALALHKKIRELYLKENVLESPFPITVLITAGGRGVFCEPAEFGFAGGRWGVRINESEPPLFDDVLRLRDKIIATLTAVGAVSK